MPKPGATNCAYSDGRQWPQQGDPGSEESGGGQGADLGLTRHETGRRHVGAGARPSVYAVCGAKLQAGENLDGGWAPSNLILSYGVWCRARHAPIVRGVLC